MMRVSTRVIEGAAMSGHRRSHREGKASIVLILSLVGLGCLVLGGLCGGGLTMFFVARPVQQQMATVMAERDAVQHEAAQLGKAAEPVGNILGSILPQSSTEKAVDTKASEANARTVFENIRAGRPQALFKRCSMDFRQTTYPNVLTEQLVKHPLPLRTEALGDEMLTLPPIDEKTHQYRYGTKTTDGRPVTFTITLVFGSPDGYGTSDWLLDQLTITDGTVEKPLQPSPGSP
jgi:hypothetical protein